MSAAMPALRAPRLLVGSARLVAAIGALALASTGEMEKPIVAAFLTLFLIGLQVERLPRLARVLAVLQPFLAAALLLVAVGDFFRVSQSFLLAVAHFLLGIQALRLLTLATPRENLGSVLVSSLMILSAATLAVDWTFFVMLVLFLPLVVWTLMLHTIVLESRSARDADPDRPLLGEGSPAWRRLAAALRRSAAAAFAVTAVCCAVVFAAFPRFNLQGFRGQFLQPVHTTGFTNQVDLNKAGKIFTDDAVVMRIEIAPQDRALWSGYVRGAALEEFDGRTWRRSNRRTDRVYPTGWQDFQLFHAPLARRLQQSVYLESMDSPVLFGAPHVVHVKIDRPFLELAEDGTVQRPNGDAWRIHYDVTSVVDTAAPGRDRAANLPPWEEALTLDVPEDVPAARRMSVDEGGRGGPAEVANRLSRYLAGHYKYTLTLAPAGDETPLQHFLATSKAGHCEYFAASLCLMLRYRNIPARMVTGFLSQEWNDRGHYVVVRMRDAHAWVEYFDPKRGWVQIDPSPREVARPSDAALSLRRRLREAWDFLNLRWNRYILSYDIERQVAFLKTVTSHSGRLSTGLERSVGKLTRWLHTGRWPSFRTSDRGNSPGIDGRRLVLPIAALALVSAAFLWRRRPADRVWFHRALVRRLAARGAAADPGRTLRELVRAAEPRFPAGREALAFLENEYYRTRFDPSYRPDRAAHRRVRRSLNSLKA